MSLKLDPGTVPRRQRSSICKCFLYSVAIMTIFLFGLGAMTILSSLRDNFIYPHKWMYQNATLEDIKDRSSIVRPLVDRTQTFDIAATVWIREPTSQLENEIEGKETLIPAEVPLFSDIIFRKLSLKDKWASNQVNLRIPTKVFKSRKLSNFDLRATFALIPNSPSLLEYAVSYSTWIPSSIPVPPKRPSEFPLGSSPKQASLENEIIDAYAINVPLISFFPINNRCGAPNGTEESINPVDIDDEDWLMDENTTFSSEKHIPKYKSKGDRWIWDYFEVEVKDGELAEEHPYIISRSHIRVADFTEILNRKAFVGAHKKLRGSSCGQDISDIKASWKKCNRGSYYERGNWETQVKLGIPDESLGKNRTEWAYAPHLSAVSDSAGPWDLIPVPTNHHDCLTNSDPDNIPNVGQDFMDVTWKISYAGRTPPKLLLGNALSSDVYKHQINMTGTEYKKALQQSGTELRHAVHGHWHHEGSHPRRSAALKVTSRFLSFICTLLDILYWYTLMNTVGISIPGALLVSLANCFKYVLMIFDHEKATLVNVLWFAFFNTLWNLPVPVLMLKVALGGSLDRWNGWVPTITVSPPSHRERSSRRTDSRTSWKLMALVYLSFAGLYYFLNPDQIELIPSKGYPNPDPVDRKLVLLLKPFTGSPVVRTGQIFQLLLNYRSSHFAGMYKIRAYLTVATAIMGLGLHMPSTSPFRDGYTLENLLDFVWAAALAWQAATLAGVSQGNDSDDPENE
ncbi:hypothetical protein M422DRAFT_37029 [Sphaerobolus stellatus SS14]|uniref:Uncharacterized protein n=1 Tax=Sphaerobolus stellatus (strain SS14) TaxID=990650 RepID=A0A0C9UV80_SPHS4|nr:hypothetical protein M422DRAFT_37029 [Sphaerobolus stellatus SS14]